MTEPESHSTTFGAAILDEGFKFRALSNGFQSFVGCPPDSATEPGVVFDYVPGLKDWITSAISARTAANYSGGSFALEFLPLDIQNDPASDRKYTTIFLVASRLTPPNALNTERVRRIQHDIKNQLGGLKLYTNFLKKRLADDSELIEIIDKMNNIVGAITQQVNQIRQEEGK